MELNLEREVETKKVIKIVLKKEISLYPRDEKGELIPKEVELVINENDEHQKVLKGETIVLTPLPRGELKKLFTDVKDDDSDKDKMIILEHCKNPSYTEDDIKVLKPAHQHAIVNTILRESGLDVGKSRSQAVEDKETEFSKN